MNRPLSIAYWTLTGLTLAACLALVFLWTPTEESMGPVQKVFYVHLPTAINTFVACLTVFVAGIGYLWRRSLVWDHLAAAAAKVAIVLCSVVLLTGMLWAKSAWGLWWTWSPRLTLSLVLWLLYVTYMLVRGSIESPHRRALVCAVYGMVAFLDVPLLHLSVRLMPDIHPSQVQLSPEMKWTLLAWFVPVTLMTVGLIAAGYRLESRRAALPQAEPELAGSDAAAAVGRLGGVG